MPGEFIGSGYEHNVFRSKDGRFVLKTQTLLSQIIFRLLKFNPSLIQKEYEEAEEMIRGTSVRIPDWRIFLFPKGYIAVQRYIEEDRSIPNIKKVLIEEGLDYLATRAITNPPNFRSNGGLVYYLDPTKSLNPSGLLDRLGIAKKEDVRKFEQPFTRAFFFLTGKPWD